MSAFLWRIVYAVLCVFIFWLIAPAFLAAIGLHLTARVDALLDVAVPCLALLYVAFGPSTGPPW